MRNYTLIPICLVAFSSVAAQNISPSARDVIDNVKQLQMRDWESYRDEVDGSPYFYDDFKEAILISKTKPDFKKAMVRYNIFEDRMELKKGDNYFSFTKDVSDYYRFKIGDAQFELIPVKHKRESFSYAEVIALGKYSFYTKHKTTFKPAQEAKGYQDAVPPTYAKQAPEHYLKDSNNVFIRIKNIKQFAEALPKYETQISKFIKKEKLKLKRIEDQKNLMSFINGLVAE